MALLLLASLTSSAGGATRTSIALDATKGKDGPSCGAPTAPCASVGGALLSARTRGLTAISLRCAEGQYPISKPLAIPSGADYEFTLTAPPLGQHRSFFACATGLPLPCVTVGDGASLRLDSLMVEAMMVAARPGGQLATHNCKFDLGAAHSAPGQVGLLGEPPSLSGAVPFVNMTDTDPESHPGLQTTVALLATAPIPARILLGIGNHSAAVAKRAAAMSAAGEDDFKGYLWKQMGHDCYQPEYRTAATPSPKKLIVVAADGSADFETVQAAVNAIPEGGRYSWADAVTIDVRAGTYTETVCINRNKSFVTLKGAGSGSTSIISAQGSVGLMWPNGSTVPNADGNWPSCGVVRIVSDDVRLQDLKVHNNGTRGGNHNVALQVLGERVTVSRASIVGGGDAVGFLMVRKHDTYDPSRGQYLIEDSYVEGAGPDIFCLLGNSTVRNTTILNRNGGNCIYYSGFSTFEGCDFISTSGMLFGNTGGSHVLRVWNSTVRKGVNNLAGIQRVNVGDTFDMFIDVKSV